MVEWGPQRALAKGVAGSTLGGAPIRYDFRALFLFHYTRPQAATDPRTPNCPSLNTSALSPYPCSCANEPSGRSC